MITVKKLWSLSVRYWKILAGFFLALGGFVVFSKIFEKSPERSDIGGAVENNSNELLGAIKGANIARDRRLVELSRAHKDKLKNLSKEQQAELEGLTQKSIVEVVAWFDKL